MTATLDDDTARPRAELALDAVRLLRERLWLRSLLLVILFAVACTYLGRWQWLRYVARAAAVHRIEANHNAAPAPLEQLLTTAQGALPDGLIWRPVTVTGSYLTERTVLIRKRAFNGVSGYEVVVPLRTPSGEVFLVDRGWLPGGRTGAGPDAVPQPPAGQVQVTARLRSSEPPSDQVPPPGQAMGIDVQSLSAGLKAPTYQAYGILDQESPQVASAPRPLPDPDLGLGNHLAYALQWWVFALGGFVLFGYFAVREAQNRDLRVEA